MFGNPSYPMYQAFLGLGIAAIIAMLLMPWWIKLLKVEGIGQQVRADGPESHLVKQGTPTMGGIIFAVPMIIVPILFSTADQRWSFLPMALVSTLGFGLVGFVDDYIKVSKKRSLGLTPMQKIVPQVVISLVSTSSDVDAVLG